MPCLQKAVFNEGISVNQLGGNRVETFSIANENQRLLAQEPYFYELCRLQAGKPLRLNQLKSFTAYIFDAPQGAAVLETRQTLATGDVVQVESQSITLAAVQALILVAGVQQASLPAVITVTPQAQIKKVVKPWGYELWLNGTHPHYAFKEILIHAPHRTSLQYHNLKRETLVLLRGRARLHYQQQGAAPKQDVTRTSIGTVDLEAFSSIDVVPKSVHRLEALTDLLLCEASTPRQ